MKKTSKSGKIIKNIKNFLFGVIMTVEKNFFLRSATELAPSMVGLLLCRRFEDGTVVKARITETECYFGEEDTACHAHKGRTPRTDVMYLEGGRAYVYLCYGIHELLNVTTGTDGHPEAVLIRGVEGASGPGRVTKLLKIDRSFNRLQLTEENGLWLEDDGFFANTVSDKRVGIAYANEKDREKPWRFIMADIKNKS